MPQSAYTARLVLDTNVWLDWLVFGDAGVAPIRRAVADGAAIVFISTACEAELVRVLGYALSGRTLSAAAQLAALSACRTIAHAAEHCVQPHDIAALPRCADPDDQIFLELARDCRADALITKDGDLLALAARKVTPLPFRILTPRKFACTFGEGASPTAGFG
jgi:putative PIN family toxin of toxin-antitoxin system